MDEDQQLDVLLAPASEPSPDGALEVWPDSGPDHALRLPAFAVEGQPRDDAIRHYVETHASALHALFERAVDEGSDVLLRCPCPEPGGEACCCDGWSAAVIESFVGWADARRPPREPGSLTVLIRTWQDTGSLENGDPAKLAKIRAGLRRLASKLLRSRGHVDPNDASSLVQIAMGRVLELDANAPRISARALARATLRGWARGWHRRDKAEPLRRAARDLTRREASAPPWAESLHQESLARIPEAYAEFRRRVLQANPKLGEELLGVVEQCMHGLTQRDALPGLTQIKSAQTLSRQINEVVRPIAQDVFAPLFQDEDARLELLEGLLRWLGLEDGGAHSS